MRYRLGKITWGLMLIAAGVLIILDVLDYFDAKSFLSVWWPLIIIVPCLVTFLAEDFGYGSLICLTIGVMFLVNNLGIMSADLVRKLMAPIILIIVGLLMLYKGFRRKRFDREKIPYVAELPRFTAMFSTRVERFAGALFRGAGAEAIFGTVTLDLTDADIRSDVFIEGNATFGTVRIIVPPQYSIMLATAGMFGGTTGSNRILPAGPDGRPVPIVYIRTTSVFGGVKVI